MSIIESARKALARMKEWPECDKCHETMPLVAVVIRDTDFGKDRAILRCPNCLHPMTVHIELPESYVKIAGYAMRFDAPPL